MKRSEMTNNKIMYFVNEELLPQIYLWGLKDGETEEEIEKYIDENIGKNRQEIIATIKSGAFDEW